MDFIGSKCPVCNQYFHADEDIVVCPDCGTPQHRACWEAIGRCYHADQHGTDFAYTGDDEPQDSNMIRCRSCGKENEKTQFFCKYCAAPLSREDEQQPNRAPGSQTGTPGGAPFGADPSMFMDPLGGIPADTDMGDGVTAGEMAKYVKQNTPYFMRVFNNIRTVNRSRFNFCAAFFSGGYLLYRKMYKIGALLTALQIGMMFLSTYITILYRDDFTNIANRAGNAGSITQILEYFSTLSKGHLFVLYIPSIVSALTLVLRIVIGFTANRMYFKHCRQQIIRIKSETTTESPETALQTKGGVNMPLAMSLFVTYMLINYLPGMISGVF